MVPRLFTSMGRFSMVHVWTMCWENRWSVGWFGLMDEFICHSEGTYHSQDTVLLFRDPAQKSFFDKAWKNKKRESSTSNVWSPTLEKKNQPPTHTNPKTNPEEIDMKWYLVHMVPQNPKFMDSKWFKPHQAPPASETWADRARAAPVRAEVRDRMNANGGMGVQLV